MTENEKSMSLVERIDIAKQRVLLGLCTINDAANYYALNSDEYDTLYTACLEAYEQLHNEKPKLRVFSLIVKQEDEPYTFLTIGYSYADVAEKYESVGQCDILEICEVTDQCRRLMEHDPVAWSDTERRMMTQFIRTINATLF